jgi:hypothetical protein
LRAMGIRDKPIFALAEWLCRTVDPIAPARVSGPHHCLGRGHLHRILKNYAAYCNGVRTHRSLQKDAPVSRPVQRSGTINSHAILGGLHHQYVRI